jgi:hypothetical protein
VNSNLRKSQPYKESRLAKVLSLYKPNKFKPNPMKLVRRNLLSYNLSQTDYEKKVITDLIYDEKKHIVSIFKDHLIWDDVADFLSR